MGVSKLPTEYDCVDYSIGLSFTAPIVWDKMKLACKSVLPEDVAHYSRYRGKPCALCRERFQATLFENGWIDKRPHLVVYLGIIQNDAGVTFKSENIKRRIFFLFWVHVYAIFSKKHLIYNHLMLPEQQCTISVCHFLSTWNFNIRFKALLRFLMNNSYFDSKSWIMTWCESGTSNKIYCISRV